MAATRVAFTRRATRDVRTIRAEASAMPVEDARRMRRCEDAASPRASFVFVFVFVFAAFV